MFLGHEHKAFMYLRAPDDYGLPKYELECGSCFLGSSMTHCGQCYEGWYCRAGFVQKPTAAMLMDMSRHHEGREDLRVPRLYRGSRRVSLRVRGLLPYCEA